MIIFYQLVMGIVRAFVWLLNAFGITRLMSKESKFNRFVEGQKTALDASRLNLSGTEEVVWVHAASLGEYSVVRPIIQKLRCDGAYIVLTFFSSTGYEALNGNSADTKEADKVLYLPLDTRRNARIFIDNVRPTKAIFAVSDLWPNYLRRLNEKHIPAFLVAAKITRRSSSMQWYGSLFRQALRSFTAIMVMDDTSEALLRKKGIRSNVVHIGDPLFDNALQVAGQDYHNPIIEQFCKDKKVFIAGSVSCFDDIKLVSHLANTYPNERFIIVPHEVKMAFLHVIQSSLRGKSTLFSTCEHNTTDLSDTQVLIVDTLGMLARIYRFGAYSYVGGGFTNKLHSVIEPIVYGLPVAFGPNIHRKNTPQELISLGVGAMVSTPEELALWYEGLRNNDVKLADISHKAIEYARRNCGSADTIFHLLSTKCTA